MIPNEKMRIRDIIEDYNSSKNELGKTQISCKKIQERIYFWMDELQIFLEIYDRRLSWTNI